jgi:hypothetical protein
MYNSSCVGGAPSSTPVCVPLVRSQSWDTLACVFATATARVCTHDHVYVLFHPGSNHQMAAFHR